MIVITKHTCSWQLVAMFLFSRWPQLWLPLLRMLHAAAAHQKCQCDVLCCLSFLTCRATLHARTSEAQVRKLKHIVKLEVRCMERGECPWNLWKLFICDAPVHPASSPADGSLPACTCLVLGVSLHI